MLSQVEHEKCFITLGLDCMNVQADLSLYRVCWLSLYCMHIPKVHYCMHIPKVHYIIWLIGFDS